MRSAICVYAHVCGTHYACMHVFLGVFLDDDECQRAPASSIFKKAANSRAGGPDTPMLAATQLVPDRRQILLTQFVSGDEERVHSV